MAEAVSDICENVDAELIRSNKRPSEPYEESFDDLVLQGTIGNLYECGRIVFLNQKDNASNRIARLLEHLIFCAVAPKSVANRQTHIVSLGQGRNLCSHRARSGERTFERMVGIFPNRTKYPLAVFCQNHALPLAESTARK